MSTVQVPAAERALARATRLQRAIHALRSEGDSRGREAAAVGAGLAIGCTPFWGTHFFLCWGAGWLFRLNRLKLYLAANLINPLVLAPLWYAEIQTGAWLRRGETHVLTRDVFRTVSPWEFGGDLLVGSLVIGALLALLGGVITYLARRPVRDPFFRLLARRAADRYLDAGITPWEFARGKLTGDPVYRHALDGALAGRGGTLVDLGCGQGLMLALIAEAQDMASAGTWLASRGQAPCFDRLIGIEARSRIVKTATGALAGEAEIRRGDLRELDLPPADVVLLFDVLHMMPADAQDALLCGVRRALAVDGRLYLREADAAAGWRFVMVRLGNRLKALLYGRWRQTFAFRTAAGWLATLEAAGFQAELKPMSEGTPFGNVWLVATPRPDAPSR